jgi:hypothetical protein
MSLENRPERKRLSKGWAKHIREQKALKRKEASGHFMTQQERIDRFALPSWENIQQKIEQRTYNDSALFSLTFRYRSVLKEYFDARYAKASGQGSEKLELFLAKYNQDEEKRNLTEKLKIPLTIIRDSFPTPKLRK